MNAFEYQLGTFAAQLAEMCAIASQAMHDATHAVLEADLGVADALIAGYDEDAAMRSSAQETTFSLLSMQTRAATDLAATDLAAVVDAVKIVADSERMDELIREIAQIARRRHPDHVVPEEARESIAEMGALAVQMARVVHDMALSGDCELAESTSHDVDAMADVHRRLVAVLIGERWKDGLAVAVDVISLAVCYRRFSDHTARIAQRVASSRASHWQPAQPPSEIALVRTGPPNPV